MASISTGPTVGQIRGKLGQSVFTAGKSGPTVRVRIKPRNPRSTGQSQVRANLAAASRAYSALSSTNLTKWANYALTITKHQRVSHTAYHPSGISIFNALTTNYLLGTPAGAIPSTPPAAPYVGDTITIAAAGSAGTITFTGSAQQTAGSKTFFLVQKLLTAARTPKPKGYTVAKVAAVPATPFQVTVTGLAAGTYAVGYKFVQLSTGLVSLPVFLGTITVS